MRQPNIITRMAQATCLLLACACSTTNLAQEPAQSRLAIATKFDEYGRIGGCDHSARLDNFSRSLYKTNRT
jgi:hypothetical protein